MSRAKTQKVAQNAASRIVQSVNRQNSHAMLYYNQKGAIDNMYKLNIVYIDTNGELEWLPCVLPVENRDALMNAAEKYFDETGIRGYFCGIQDPEHQ